MINANYSHLIVSQLLPTPIWVNEVLMKQFSFRNNQIYPLKVNFKKEVVLPVWCICSVHWFLVCTQNRCVKQGIIDFLRAEEQEISSFLEHLNKVWCKTSVLDGLYNQGNFMKANLNDITENGLTSNDKILYINFCCASLSLAFALAFYLIMFLIILWGQNSVVLLEKNFFGYDDKPINFVLAV